MIDPNKRYELPELIDLAQRVNPETRVAWEAARRSALAVGLVESEYFPVLAISALGGYKSVGVPIPKNLVSDGFFRFDLAQAVPALNLRWLLARLRSPRERSRRREGTAAGREPRVQSQAPADRLRRAARVLRPHQRPCADRGRSELTRCRPRGAGGDGAASANRARHASRGRPGAAADGPGLLRTARRWSTRSETRR